MSVEAGYAELGWRVFPCRPREKRPLFEGWQGVATDDPAILADWARRHHGCNWALRCGPESGVFVLDCDGPEGEAALTEMERRHGGALPDAFPLQWTGSGRGWQGFFLFPPGREVRNRKLGPKLETRGDGGYAMLPPSVHPSGRRYRWADDRSPWDAPPPDAPGWLLDLIDPPPPPPRQAWSVGRGMPGRDGSAYALKAYRSELALVAVAREGGRNVQLNASAHALFRFVAAGELTASGVRDGLLAAASHAGLDGKEAGRTIASAAKSRGVSLR